MRTFEWTEPTSCSDMTPVIHTITDYEIILIFWLRWSNEVFEKRPDNTFYITADNCIDDFCMLHWCDEIT